MRVRFGVSVPNFGNGLDARRVADWARAAESAGWDGFFLWDHLFACYPPPVQRPRVPMWVGGTWPGRGPFRRAARWDGVFPMRANQPWEVADTAAVRDAVRAERTVARPFDLAVPGDTEPDDDARHDRHAAHEAADATWWIEGVHPWRYGWGGREGETRPARHMFARIVAGP